MSEELQLSPDQLRELAGEIAAALAPAGALLDAKGAARLLNVPASWVLAQARDDKIPHVRHGKYVRFDPDELRAWTATCARGPRRPGGRDGP